MDFKRIQRILGRTPPATDRERAAPYKIEPINDQPIPRTNHVPGIEPIEGSGHSVGDSWAQWLRSTAGYKNT